MLNDRKRRPTHPGEVLREELLPAMGLTQKELAHQLGVSRRTINEIVLEKRGLTADMAHRLARFFNTSPELWLGLQEDVDLWDTMKAKKKDYSRIKPLRPRLGVTVRVDRRTDRQRATVP